MSDCINRECSGKKAGVCLNDFPGVKCYGYEPPRKTNADRIRSMSDEELAAWLCDVAGWLPAFEGRVHPILEWLQQEAPYDQP